MKKLAIFWAVGALTLICLVALLALLESIGLLLPLAKILVFSIAATWIGMVVVTEFSERKL